MLGINQVQSMAQLSSLFPFSLPQLAVFVFINGILCLSLLQ